MLDVEVKYFSQIMDLTLFKTSIILNTLGNMST